MAAVLEFGGEAFAPAGDAALFWPRQQALLVADLHLEKASSLASTSGQMLPPYDSVETLTRLSELAENTGARRIFCLGDNFHDDGGEIRLPEPAARMLAALTSRYEWHWIVGNHDPGMKAIWGGQLQDEMAVGGIMLRHNIDPGDNRAEISGHYHPKLRRRIRGRLVSRVCFLHCGDRLILPAFGALTGGMDAENIIAAESALSHGKAMLPVSGRLATFMLGDAEASRARTRESSQDEMKGA